MQNQPQDRETEPPGEERKRPSDDELVDNLLERAGGIGLFHVLFYLAIGSGANCIRSFVNYLIPFQI